MRILHILQPPVGGSETIVRLLIRAQAEHHEVGVVCHPKSQVAREATGLGARVWTLAMTREVRPFGDARHLLALRRIVRAYEPEVVHAHSSKAGALGRPAARSLGVPVVFSPHNFAYRAYEGGVVARSLFYFLERSLAPLTSFLHAACDDERRDAIARRMADPSRCATVQNGIDVTRFANLAAPSSRPPVIGTYARLRWQKGVDVLVHGASALAREGRPLRCVIVGDGPLRPDLLRLVNELRVTPFVSLQSDMGDARRVLSDIDIFVLPSRTESYPLVVMEAMAAGRPVVATAVGGVPEMVRHERNGLLVPPEDPAALAAAIGRLLDDEPMRKRLGDAARREAVRRFDYRRMAERLEAVYADTIGQHRRLRRRSAPGRWLT